MRQLLKLATPEMLYMKRATLPKDMLDSFFTHQAPRCRASNP